MSTCIISGRFPETEFKSYINHKLYADTYGYSYIHCNWPTLTDNNYLNKIVYVQSFLDQFDHIVWIDDDAFFFDFDKDIMDFAPKGDSFISFCKSPTHKDLKTFLSSGQFIVKCNELSKMFFKELLETEIESVKAWWPESLGFFTNGDQDIIIHLLQEREAYKDKFDLHDYKSFNSRVENLFETDRHKPLILHFTGRGKTKHENLKKVREQLNLHPSLVSNSLLQKYSVNTAENYAEIGYNSKKKTQFSKILSKLKRWLRG